MSTNFNIFGESNDAASKLKFKDNSNMEFTIALPERFRLSDWQVCLKSLILPSRMWNIYDETMPKWKFTTNIGENEVNDKIFRFQWRVEQNYGIYNQC